MKRIIVIGILVLVMLTGVLSAQSTSIEKKSAEKKSAEKNSEEKKLQFEFSLGFARCNPMAVYDRNRGIDSLVAQYAQYYSIAYSADGTFTENKLFIPVSLAASYRLNEKLFLRAGIDFMSGSTDSNKSYTVSWSNFNEQHDYNLKSSISLVMPHAGVGYRYQTFEFFGALGIGIASLKQTEVLAYSEPNYSHDITEVIDASGTAPGIIIGAKYNLPFKKQLGGRVLGGFVKIEAVILNIGTLTGSLAREAVNSAGDRTTRTTDGTAYTYTWNPYGESSFNYWSITESLPNAPDISNPEKLKLNLSGIRFMLGISF